VPLRLFIAIKSELTEDNDVVRHCPEGAIEGYYLWLSKESHEIFDKIISLCYTIKVLKEFTFLTARGNTASQLSKVVLVPLF